jgi:ADP-heptose:LPS heptosyltransferase
MKGADRKSSNPLSDSPSGVIGDKKLSGMPLFELIPEIGRIKPPEGPRGEDSIQHKPPPRLYAYRNPWVVRAFRLLDSVCGRLFGKKRERPGTIERVLVMRPDHLGDFLFSLPALKALRDELPDARIDVLVSPLARQLIPDNWKEWEGFEPLEFSAPWLQRPKKVRFGLKATLGLTRLLRKRRRDLGGRYDLVIDLRGDFQLILASRLAGVRYLVGKGHTGLGSLLDVEVNGTRGRHQVEMNLAQLESAGFGLRDTTSPELILSKEEEAEGESILRTQGVDGSKILIGMHVGAGQPTKLWGVDKYAELIRRIVTDRPSQVVLLGGPDDRAVTDDVLISLKGSRVEGRVFNLCGKLPDLRTFMMVAKQCALFVGNDSGPAHIAAALQVPVVSIFSGTNDPAEWGPRGPSVVIVRRRIACEGCGLTQCDHLSCMAELDIDVVYQAVRRCV